MKSKEILSWEKHAADLYVLLSDIVENMNLQQLGYKLYFYYKFNPRLPYLGSDGSDYAQEKLLLQLKDKNLLNFEFDDPHQNTPVESLSKNYKKFSHKISIYLTVNPDEISNELPKLKDYSPSELLNRGSSKVSKDTVLNSNGKLYIKGRDEIIEFKVHLNSYKLLDIILANEDSRYTVWTHDELIEYLEQPKGIKYPWKLVSNTAKEVNKKIKKETSSEVKNFLINKDRNAKTNLYGKEVPAEKTVTLNNDFV